MKKQKIVVVGNNSGSRLGMARAIGSLGYRVDLISLGTPALDQYTKYVEQYICCKQEELLQILLDNYKGMDEKTIIVPIDDFAAALIDEKMDELCEDFLIPGVPGKSGEVKRLMDKYEQKCLADEVGMCIPKYWRCSYKGEGYEIPEQVEYPCFVKIAKTINGGKNYFAKCKNEDELRTSLEAFSKSTNADMLVEQYLNIACEYNVQGFSDGNEIMIPVVIKKEHDRKGTTAVGKIMSAAKYDELVSQITHMVQRIGFAGMFDVDIIECDGKLYFNELNFRCGASGCILTNIGINMPGLYIDWVNGDLVSDWKKVYSGEDKFFANERVCFMLYTDRSISWKQYQELINKVDFYYIESKDDPKPVKEYKKNVLKKRIKRLFK